MDSIWQAILTEAIPVITVFVKGLVAAVVVGSLAQITVEYLLAPAAASDLTPGFVTPLSAGFPRRLATLFLAQAAVVACHGLDIWTYGSGPKGWGAAAFFGFLAGGVAPGVHDKIRSRLAGKP